MDDQHKLKVTLYLLAVTAALLVELLLKGGLAGTIAAFAVYLPVHNWFWGRV